MKKKLLLGYGKVDKVKIGEDSTSLLVYAIESEVTLFYGCKIKKVCKKLGVKFIYKSCYDKDCRSSFEFPWSWN